MARRAPNGQADHTVAIIAGLVVLVGLLVALALGLEATESPNTLAILGVLGTGLGAVVVGQLVQISKTNLAADVARKAAETADDTNQRAQQIQHALNGEFEPRLRSIVQEVVDDLDRRWERRLDDRLAALEARLDKRVVEIVHDELARQSRSRS